MKAMYLPKVDINEGLRSGNISKSAMVFFDDVFFTIPFKVTNMFDQQEQRFNGKEIFEQVKTLIDGGKTAEAYDYLTQSVPDENVFYVKMLDIFKIKVGWWIFGGFYYRKQGGMKKTASVLSSSKRAELREMYSRYVQ